MALQDEITATKRKLEELERAAAQEATHTEEECEIERAVNKMSVIFTLTEDDREFMRRFVRTPSVRFLRMKQTRTANKETAIPGYLGNDIMSTEFNVEMYGTSDRTKMPITLWITFGSHIDGSLSTATIETLKFLPPGEFPVKSKRNVHHCKIAIRDLMHKVNLSSGQDRWASAEKAMRRTYQAAEEEFPELDADARRFLELMFSSDDAFLAGNRTLSFAQYAMLPSWKKSGVHVALTPLMPDCAHDFDEQQRLEGILGGSRTVFELVFHVTIV